MYLQSNILTPLRVVWTCDHEIPDNVINWLCKNKGKGKYFKWGIGDSIGYDDIGYTHVDNWLLSIGGINGELVIILVDY